MENKVIIKNLVKPQLLGGEILLKVCPCTIIQIFKFCRRNNGK